MNALAIRTGVIALFALLLLGGCGGSRGDISSENIEKITPEMKKPDVEKLIGAPGIRLADFRFNDFTERRRGVLEKTTPGATRYLWQESNAAFYIDVHDASGAIVSSGRFAGTK